MSSKATQLSKDEVQLVEENWIRKRFWSSRFWRACAGKKHLGCQLWLGHGGARDTDPRMKNPCPEALVCIAALRKSEILSEGRNSNMKMKHLCTAIWY